MCGKIRAKFKPLLPELRERGSAMRSGCYQLDRQGNAFKRMEKQWQVRVIGKGCSGNPAE
jgi:hypothetical protein